MPKSCIMFVWKIKFYSCVVRLLSYWVHCWNLIFQHKAHYVFRNPSWCHTFHFDVNFSLLSFVSRLHFAINILKVKYSYDRSSQWCTFYLKTLWMRFCFMKVRRFQVWVKTLTKRKKAYQYLKGTKHITVLSLSQGNYHLMIILFLYSDAYPSRVKPQK